jgi:BirA family biotin operon repressor/biotin-[acetyl-CoA-carboxylase] ligase
VSIGAPWPVGYGCKAFDVLDSTNEEARRLALAGEQGPVWITAGRQTAGRGRRGRQWETVSGNLAATLFLRPGRPAADCAQLSFVAALAAHDVVSGYVLSADVRVKWPNDILVDGKKICGILLESASSGTVVPDWLAIGLGLNLATFPDRTETPATSIAAFGAPVPAPAAALQALAASFAGWYQLWHEKGFAPVREAWLARAAGLGTRIRARLEGGEWYDVFEGIDENGALILREVPGRLRIIAAGEIFFG